MLQTSYIFLTPFLEVRFIRTRIVKEKVTNKTRVKDSICQTYIQERDVKFCFILLSY